MYVHVGKVMKPRLICHVPFVSSLAHLVSSRRKEEEADDDVTKMCFGLACGQLLVVLARPGALNAETDASCVRCAPARTGWLCEGTPG